MIQVVFATNPSEPERGVVGPFRVCLASAPAGLYPEAFAYRSPLTANSLWISALPPFLRF